METSIRTGKLWLESGSSTGPDQLSQHMKRSLLTDIKGVEEEIKEFSEFYLKNLLDSEVRSGYNIIVVKLKKELLSLKDRYARLDKC